jgi:hypothetical protein
MKLRFLGRTYSAVNNSIETIASERTARFLGQEYIINVPIRTVQSRSLIKKYRGVIYDA